MIYEILASFLLINMTAADDTNNDTQTNTEMRISLSSILRRSSTRAAGQGPTSLGLESFNIGLAVSCDSSSYNHPSPPFCPRDSGSLEQYWQVSYLLPLSLFSRFSRPVSNPRDPDEVGTTTENVGCEGEYWNQEHLRLLPTGWKLIQRRGQYGNPEDFFSLKLWNDYEQGFGEPEKGKILVSF